LNIGISGPIGAGKTTAAKYLSINLGLSYLRYSEILAKLSAADLSERSALRDFGWDVMSRGQQNLLNSSLLSEMKGGFSYVIDGLRHPLDFETLSTQDNPTFFLLYIDASPSIRWTRVKNRDGFRTREEFKSADCHPVEGNLSFLKDKAYKILLNEETLGVFEQNLEFTVKELTDLVKQ